LSLTSLLDSWFVQPLLEICGAVFAFILDFIPSPGLALVAFSVVVNLALLPVYYHMERAGRASASSREAMRAEIKRIKAHYKGRERYYYIKTIYRQFGYRPISVVFTSTDLYLQILVFATAYRFISHHPLMLGSSFLFISDLSQPDGLLFGANLLPLVMTAFNVLSALLYSGEKAKRRNAFILSGLFLLLLYNSSSGLVLYWTTNNAFSLVRNLFDRKIVHILPAPLIRAVSKVFNQV
jgi:membrane protein insertase Oxa1/YidC/SpoIIIJ